MYGGQIEQLRPGRWSSCDVNTIQTFKLKLCYAKIIHVICPEGRISNLYLKSLNSNAAKRACLQMLVLSKDGLS